MVSRAAGVVRIVNGGRGQDERPGPSLLARKPLLIFGVAVGVGVVPVVLHAAVGGQVARVLGVGLILASAALMVGAFLGFLFGIPRAYSSDAPNGAPGAAPTMVFSDSGYTGNTNLEQISDWLTKILLGAGLTQLANIPSGGARLFNAMGSALGDGSDSAVFAGAVTIYFAVLGFLLGWLSTRLFLGPGLHKADQRARRLFAAATVAEQEGRTAEATSLRNDARSLLTENRDDRV